MTPIDRRTLKALVETLDSHLEEPAQLLLVGGSAVVVLCPDAKATKDLDAFPTTSIDVLLQTARRVTSMESIDINTQSAGFETYLPQDWESRIILSSEFSGENLQVFTPCPEDLAVMKVFRYMAKDAQDIEKLSRLPSFDPSEFKRRFLDVLPIAIGEPRWHAQSFAMIWNRLYPDSKTDTDEIVGLAEV